ncbi:MAG: 5-oxoprolinase subunit B family protein [Hyphomonas sp.]
MTGPDIRPIGDDALALIVTDRSKRHALAAALRATGKWRDVVPGKGDVTVQFDPLALPPAEALAILTEQARTPPRPDALAAAPVTLTLLADTASAPDLAAVADANRLTQDALLARIAASPLIVDMMGFTPGFAYVEGVDPALQAERLAAPRQKVPAGSVGILTGQLGFYALSGPAGWPVIGRILEPLFDPAAATPFRLEAGMHIQIEIRR